MNTKWRTLWLLSFLILANNGLADAAKKRVCIIGMGAAGIAAVKQVAMHPDDFETVAFEKRSEVGGLWIYTEDTGFDEFGFPIRSNAYKYLRTNGPKDLMTYPDYNEFHGENRSYVTHMDMLRYLQNYTDHFNLDQYIQFNTLVEKVSRLSDSPNTQWNVRTRNLRTNEYAETVCDAVLLCNGHYSKPYVPEISGMETFPGPVLHSIFYRRPEAYTGQTVVVLGAGTSGTDIGIQISWYAKKVYLSHRNKLDSELPENMEQVPGVVSVNGNEMILSDGRVITADVFVLCTGYEYDFPFLGDDSGIEIVQGKYVRPLYKGFININYPSMAFISLQFPSIPYAVAYVQTQLYITILQGKTTLPDREVMLKDSELPPDVPIKKAHYMGETSVLYYDDLAAMGNLDTLGDKYLARVFDYWGPDKKGDILYFKDKDVIVHEDGSIHLERKYYPIYGVDHFDEDIVIY